MPYNIMGKVVHDVLMEHLDQLHLRCTCERCIDDIMALSLNMLPPQYIVNDELGPYVRAAYVADQQGAINILSAVAKAAEIVSNHPRCHTTLNK